MPPGMCVSNLCGRWSRQWEMELSRRQNWSATLPLCRKRQGFIRSSHRQSVRDRGLRILREKRLPFQGKTLSDVREISGTVNMKILVSLSCTMCPELVTAAQRIAAENPFVTAEVYDLNHFPALKDRYQVMSVPCLVINDGKKVVFGKKNVGQVVELINSL